MSAGLGAAGELRDSAKRFSVNRLRRPRGLERSAFLSQLTLVAAMLCLGGVITVMDFPVVDSATFLTGYGLLGALTAATVLVEWSRLPKLVLLVIPLGDILAIALTSLSSNTISFSLLNVLPVIWLATYFRLLGVVLSVVLPTVIQIGRVVRDPFDPGLAVSRLFVIPIVLGFVAVTVYLARRRMEAQRALLHRQADDLQQAVTQARRNEDYLDATLEAVGFGIISFDLEGRPGFVNATYREMHRQVDGSSDVLDFREVYSADGFTPVEESETPLRRALRDGDVSDTVVWVGAPGGNRLALAVSARRIYDLGKPDGVVLICRDVTAERQAIRARDDLVAMVSHELRTPLTAIIGYLELALEGELDTTTSEMLTVAAANAERIISLTDDFRAAASGVDNAAELDRRRTATREIVEQSIAALTPLAEERRVSVEFQTSDEVEAYVDEFRLRQVIDNLISNAIKYCRQGGSVVIATRRDPGETVISVTNDSDGLTAEELGRIFDRFYRTDSARRSSTEGTGLGLAISNEIINRHGGRITAESVPDRSVTFTVTLPNAPHDPS